MENKFMDNKAIIRKVEAILFIMLGIFCLAFKTEALPTITIGSAALSAKDLLGLAYIFTGYFFAHWPSVHFVRPSSMEQGKPLAA